MKRACAQHALVASSFDQAMPFYTQAILVTSEKKSRRNDSNGAVIGAHTDGDLGIVSAGQGTVRTCRHVGAIKHAFSRLRIRVIRIKVI